MKKVFVLVLLLVPCLSLLSLDLGVGVDGVLWVASAKEGSFEAYNTWLRLSPALVLMVSPRLEVRPFAIFEMSKISDPADIESTWDADRLRIEFGLGAGLYYHFIQREIISLCTGPQVSAVLWPEPSGSSYPDYDSYFQLVTRVAIPVYLDIRLSKRLFLRTGIEFLAINIRHENFELAGVKNKFTALTVSSVFWDTLDELETHIGFYLMF
jgi:hypothetical protein